MFRKCKLCLIILTHISESSIVADLATPTEIDERTSSPEVETEIDERTSSPEVESEIIELETSDDNWSTQSLIVDEEVESERLDSVIESDEMNFSDEMKASESPKTIILCPSCYFKVPVAEIGRHIVECHPNLVVADDEEILVAEETVEPEKSVQEQVLPAAVCQPKSPKRNPAFGNLTPASEACVACPALGCKQFVHQSNMARHWRNWHPELRKPQSYQAKRKSDSVTDVHSGSAIKVFPASDAVIKVEIGEKVIDLNTLNVLATTETSSQQQSNLPMVDGQYVCMFKGCNYTTKFNSNMWRHQRKYEHCSGNLNQTV